MSTLRAFWTNGHADAELPLRAWYDTVDNAVWTSLADVRNDYPSVDLVGDKLIFNIKGNKYRLICKIEFGRPGLYIKWVGTHAEYDRLSESRIKAM